MYPSLNYATGKDNSRTEALGKAFFCLYVASVVQQGLHFLHLLLTLIQNIHGQKIAITVLLFVFAYLFWKGVSILCCLGTFYQSTYSVWGTPVESNVNKMGGLQTLGVETHVFHLCDTQLLLALTMVEIICLHLSIEKEPLGLNS